MGKFTGKTAVITGGGGGIAHGYALACLKEGMKIVLADINEQRLDEVKAKLVTEVSGSEIAVFKMDATKQEDVDALAKFTIDTFGSVYMIFNNAGVHFHKHFMLLTDKDWDFITKCNFWAVVLGMRTFIPLLKDNEDGGYIVNTASGASVGFGSTMSHYCSCKAAVMALSGAVQRELLEESDKILVTCVFPDFVTSNLMDSCADVRETLGYVNEVEEQSPMDQALEGFFYSHVTAPYLGKSEIPDATVLTNEHAADVVMDAIKANKNFVFTHLGTFSNGATLARQLDGGYLDKG